jgi:hypothetical protein
MTPPGGGGAVIQGVTLEELLNMDKTVPFPSLNMTQHNTASPRSVIHTIKDAAKKGERIEIVGWDSDTSNLIQFVSNPGHSPGIDAQYFIDDLKRYVRSHPGKGTMNDQLSAYLIDSSNQIDRGHIDFFQVDVYH